MASSLTTTQNAPLVCPLKGSDGASYKAFFDRFADVKSPARQERLANWMESKAFVESYQWLQRMTQSLAGRVPRWVEQVQASIPQPVQNELLPLVNNEHAKLCRKKSVGRVKAKVQRQGQEGAARAGNEILDWHLKSIKWPRIRRRGIYRDVLFGTMILKSWWELSYADTVTVGIPEGAMTCAGQPGGMDGMGMEVPPVDPCGWTVASKKVPKGLGSTLALAAPEKASLLTRVDTPQPDQQETEGRYEFNSCLDCASPLKPTVPDSEQAKTKDPFGRPLGQKVPKGNATVDSLAPWEVYFENEGIGVEPDTLREFVIETIKPLSWVKEHYKSKELDSLKPEEQRVLIENYPILGEYQPQSGGSRTANTRNLFTHHVRVREYYHLSSGDGDLGRMVHLVGNIVVVDDDLCVKAMDERGEEQVIPRVKLGIARFWRQDGELYGMPITRPLLSPQRRINMMFSQIIDSRERNVDLILSTPGMKLRSPGATAGLHGSRLIFDPDPEHPEGPKFLPARTYDAAVYQEHDRTREYMREAVGAQDADLGKIPGNSNVPALLIKTLQDQVAIQREEREEELKDAFTEVYQHQMLLLQRFAREPRNYWVMGPGEQWEEKQFIGADLVGQTDIEIEEEASYDKDAYDKEMIIQADKMGVLPKNSPMAIYEILKSLGVSTKLAETQNVQIEDAARKWAMFKDQGLVPTIEPTQDAHDIKFNYYATALFGDDGIALKDKARWSEVVKALAGWEQTLQQAEMLDQQVRQWQKTASAPEAPPPISSGDPVSDMQAQAEAKIRQQGRQAAVMGLQSIGDPQPAMLPEAPEDKIFTVWTRMLQARQYPLQPDQVPFLRFESVVEGHRGLANMALQTPAPQVAAPGSAPPQGAPAMPGPPQGAPVAA